MPSEPIAVTADPAELGFDPSRLERIEQHFDRYVAAGKLPGYLATVAREGQVVHMAKGGLRDVERGLPVEADTLFRIYSMTKPITSVVLMSFFEEGRFKLNDPVEWYIPAFADARVYAGGTPRDFATVPVTEPVRIWHLLTHTAGLTYGFNYVHPCDALYRAEGLEWGAKQGITLAEACDLWARLPLRFQPGSAWNYSVATDVCGRLCEIFGGKSLPEVFAERILGPLGMDDTSFVCGPDEQHRLADLYLATPGGGIAQAGPMAEWAKHEATAPSGGGGLISTAADYHKFTSMLLRGGAYDGGRILGPRTLDFMAANHLPGGVDLAAAEVDGFSETDYRGVGFGLGFAVMLNPLESKMFSSAGDFYWGGMASTAFYVDPTEQLTVQFFTQVLPSTTYPIREELRQLVFQAITE